MKYVVIIIAILLTACSGQSYDDSYEQDYYSDFPYY